MGKIEVRVQQQDRLNAINNLSKAIRSVAKALEANVTVNVSECNFSGPDIGMLIDTEKELGKTDLIVHEEE